MDLEIEKIKNYLYDNNFLKILQQPIFKFLLNKDYDKKLVEINDKLSKERIEQFSNINIFENGERLLDIGCNCGFNSFLLNHTYSLRIDACDILSQAIKFCNELKKALNTKDINFYLKDWRNNNFKDYDYILLSNMIPDLNGFFKYYNYFLRNQFNGKIILIYPDSNFSEINKTLTYFSNSFIINKEVIII